MSTFDPARGDLGVCVRCGKAIHWGQPYMEPIPFVGSWGGFEHVHCPPTLILVVSNGTGS